MGSYQRSAWGMVEPDGVGRNRRATTIVILVVLVSWLVAAWATPGLGRVATALLFVLGVFLIGSFCGLVPALIVSIVDFLLYNFYVAQPTFSLKINHGKDLAPLLAFSLCALVAGLLARQLKDRTQAARLSNTQLESLLEASQLLQSAVRVTDIQNIVSAGITLPPSSTIRLFLVRDGSYRDMMSQATGDPGLILAQRSEGAAINPMREDTYLSYRLDGGEGFEGILLFQTSSTDPLESAFMAALANLIALAVERASLSESNADARALARTEELKTALLSSVSHDFRTPLTAISASASSLIEFHAQLDAPATFKLLRGIVNDCERLNRYTANLLEMSRLEADQAFSCCQNLDVADTLTAVVQRVRQRAGNRKIETRLGSDSLIVHADASLFELVLVNVLENAVTYSEDGTRISVDVGAQGNQCAIVISDQGQGIPAQDLTRIFERFYRVARTEPSPRGSGLGLAIAKGFVEALGGTIHAKTPGIDDRGTAVTILLPTVQEDRIP